MRRPPGSMNFIGATNQVPADGSGFEPSEEQKRSAMRAVCGARSCKDAADAKYILEVIGLIGEKPRLNRKVKV